MHRFGERPKEGVRAMLAMGVSIPKKVREVAVYHAPKLDKLVSQYLHSGNAAVPQQPQLADGFRRQVSNPNSNQQASCRSVQQLACWMEDPELDLDELGDWVPEWACRMTRQQLLDLEAAEAWRMLRTSGMSNTISSTSGVVLHIQNRCSDDIKDLRAGAVMTSRTSEQVR
jgi:hypothetical protein